MSMGIKILSYAELLSYFMYSSIPNDYMSTVLAASAIKNPCQYLLAYFLIVFWYEKEAE